MQISATGLAWYKEEQWEAFKCYCTDGNMMADSFDFWLKGALNAIKQMKKQNIKLYKIVIDLDDFIKYCNNENLEPNGNARANYVNLKVYQGYQRGNLQEL